MMKPQLYSIIILLLARVTYMQDTKNSTQDATTSSTQLSLIPNTTSVAKTPEESVTSTTKAPDDHKTSAPENNVTSVTKAPKGNTTSVAKTSHETTNKITVLSEAPNSKATPAPSLAPNVSPSLAPNVSSVHTTKEFTMTTRSDGIPRATGSTSISIGKQTSNPTLAGNATTQRINKVTNTVRKTTRPTSTKSTTAKATGNRTSTFQVPLLFAIVLLVVSVLCF
ncbi:mucin-2-like [Notechis scutatus]|uniref:Mucin-2-like n=1 Tax=Notechis scutatus TaxID=8663 RepID=A0A6J1V8T3_9SAUR|nr:mucin-2-like [Notechis scutatus]